jgi:hypothetical protein
MTMSTIRIPNDCFRHTDPSTRTFIGLAILLLLVGLGTGCSNTELAQSWVTPKFNGTKFTSFVVMGVSPEPTLRRVAEDAFVHQLALNGIRAVPSYDFLPSDPEQLTREQVERAVKQQAAQGAIVARVSKVEKQTSYSGGMASYGNAGFAGAYQRSGSGPSVQGGSSYEYDIVTVDVQLYDVKTSDLVWSGVTRTFDTSNLESSTTYWAKVVIQELTKRGLI